MKLTKAKLKQIIREELEKLSIEEGSMGTNEEQMDCVEIKNQIGMKQRDIHASSSDDPLSYEIMFLKKDIEKLKKMAEDQGC
jgi:hypothetical protein